VVPPQEVPPQEVPDQEVPDQEVPDQVVAPHEVVAEPRFARSPQRVGVLALQGDFREHIELLRALGAEAFEVKGPAELQRAEALVLPGGESTTMSLLLESSGLLGPLAERLAQGMPAFGTCAGMILLATDVLDGRADQHHFGVIDISVRRNAFGRQRDSFEADLDIEGLVTPLHAVFVRAPVVERAGPEVEVLATVTVDGAAPADFSLADFSVAGTSVAGTGAHKPVVCRQGPVLVTSFHPELAGDARLHELFLRSLRANGAKSMGRDGTITRKDNVRAL
jgi:pyridoxal 5'-phosphate synthase pdxT subunit